MSRHKATLSILQVIAPHRYSGAERIAIHLADELRRRGHRVAFACNDHEGFRQQLAHHDIDCLSTAISGKLNPLRLYRLVQVGRRFGADVIHTHLSSAAWLGSLAGRLLHVPVLAHVHALNTKTCFVRADMLAACSEGVRRHLLAQGLPEDQVRVIYNGIDLARLAGLRPLRDVRADMGIRDGQPVIGVAAHLTPKKGQRHLIEATALLRDKQPRLLCYLLGEGEQRAKLESLAAHLGIRQSVRFMGYRPDAVDLMQAMDIVVLPSVRKEGLGLCLVEASALGKAVIGSDAPGIDEVIRNERTGLLVPPGNAEALASAVDRLIGDRGLRERMGAAGKQRVRELFTLEHMADKAEQFYYEMIQAR